jgi:LacI family transcriptional regulator
VIGFDDIEADLMLDPSLTTIKVPKDELGIEALRLIVNFIKNKKALHKKIVIPVELIVRESTSICKLK